MRGKVIILIISCILVLNTLLGVASEDMYYFGDAVCLLLAAVVPFFISSDRKTKAIALALLILSVGSVVDELYFDRKLLQYNDVTALSVSAVSGIVFYMLSKDRYTGSKLLASSQFATLLFIYILVLPMRNTTLTMYFVTDALMYVLWGVYFIISTKHRSQLISIIYTLMAGHNLIDEVGYLYNPDTFNATELYFDEVVLSIIIYGVGFGFLLFTYPWAKGVFAGIVAVIKGWFKKNGDNNLTAAYKQAYHKAVNSSKGKY